MATDYEISEKKRIKEENRLKNQQRASEMIAKVQQENQDKRAKTKEVDTTSMWGRMPKATRAVIIMLTGLALSLAASSMYIEDGRAWGIVMLLNNIINPSLFYQ